MAPDDPIDQTLEILNGTRRRALDTPVPEDGLSMSLQPAARPTPWNKSEVLDRLGDDQNLLREMCGIFLSESATLLQKLRQAVSQGEAEVIMRAAHSLKGEVSYLSASAATQAARRLEDMGHDHDISQAPQAFALLEREMEFLCCSIREFVGVEP